MVDGWSRMRLEQSSFRFFTLAMFIRSFVFSLLNFLIIRKNYVELYVLHCNFLNLLRALKFNVICGLKTLNDIVVTDFIKNPFRFKLSYNFLSIWGLRVFVHIFLKETELGASLRFLYPVSN